MTRRSPLLAAGFLVGLTPLFGQMPTQPTNPPANPKQSPVAPTVEIYGSVRDPNQQSAAPANGLILTDTAWKGLARAWGITNPMKVDFKKEFLVVATSQSAKMTLTPRLDESGDLRVSVDENKETQGGFRYGVRSVPRTGVKTVNGK